MSHVLALHDGGMEALPEVARVPASFAEPIRVRAVPDPRPRTYVAARAEVLGDAAALERLASPGFDLAHAIVIPPDAAGAAPGSLGPADGPSRVVEERSDHVRLAAEPSAPGYVVLLDAWAPGWSARVDGRAAELLRANVAFRAVPVPAGRHTVDFDYAAPGAQLGSVLSLGSALIALGLTVRGSRS